MLAYVVHLRFVSTWQLARDVDISAVLYHVEPIATQFINNDGLRWGGSLVI